MNPWLMNVCVNLPRPAPSPRCIKAAQGLWPVLEWEIISISALGFTDLAEMMCRQDD